jgi:hypothetical protein
VVWWIALVLPILLLALRCCFAIFAVRAVNPYRIAISPTLDNLGFWRVFTHPTQFCVVSRYVDQLNHQLEQSIRAELAAARVADAQAALKQRLAATLKAIDDRLEGTHLPFLMT